MASRIRFYSPEGEHLYSVGKRGNGPREFGDGFLDLLRGYGDTLLVVDWRNLQTHRLAPDGTWLGNFSIRPEGEWRVSGWDTAPSGLIISTFAPMQLPDTPLPDTMDVIVVRHLDGTLGDTLGREPMRLKVAPEIRFYAGIPDFTSAEQTTLMARLDEMLKSSNQAPERIEQIKSSIRFEDHYPYYRGFKNGPKGTLWLRRVRPIRNLTEEEIQALTFSRRVRPGQGWDVFDGQGRFLGVVEAPPELAYGGLRDSGRMFSIVTDEFDVQYLQIYQVEGLHQPVAVD